MTEDKISWGLYDEFGHLLPQDPAEGPDKTICYDLEEFRCDICGAVLGTCTGLSTHRRAHFKPHNNDWSCFSEQMKKRKMERDEEQRAKKRKVEAEKPEVPDENSTAEKDEDVESDETEELSHTPGSSVRSTPSASPAATPSSRSPNRAIVKAPEKLASECEISREMLIKEAKKRFSAKQIAAELLRRKSLFECICGILFQDFPMFILHRGMHHTENPLQCSHCRFVAQDQKTFMVHFFKHKKTN